MLRFLDGGRGGPERGPYESPYFTATFYPEDASFNTLVQTIRKSCRTVELFEIVPSSCVRAYAIDPVCKMQVDTHSAAGKLQFNGRTHWFCSIECVERFARQPAAYA